MRLGGRLAAAGHAQLAEDVGHVDAGRLGRDEQLARDLPVAAPGRDQAEHLEFAFGEPELAGASYTRSVPATQPELHGGGGLLLAGAEYFHNCPNSMTGNCSAPPTNYETSLGLWGGTGNGTSLYGEIVVDKLSLQGNSGINMALMPNNYIGLSAAVLQ